MALAPPIDARAATNLPLHMAQHVVLTAVAAPLVAFAIASYGPTGTRLGSRPWPVVTAAAFVASLWTWHLPAPFLAAVRNAPLHGLEHVCLLGTAIAFWTSVVVLTRRSVPGAGAMALVAVAIANTAFAAAITLWPRPVYGASLTHQQVAGVVMWAGGGLAYTGTLVVLFARWLAGNDRAVRGFAASLESVT